MSRAPQPKSPDHSKKPLGGLLSYLLLGVVFGIVATKSEVVSWYRIQEMFRFESFHMYGIIGSAVAVGAVSIALIRRFQARHTGGEAIDIPPKVLGKGTRYWAGGTVFGVGWGLVGVCPGPIFTLLGNGVSVIVVVLLAALAGTWTYAALRPRLPH